MTTRKSVTVNGVTWYYSGSPAAWPTMHPSISVTGKSGVNTQFSGDGNDTMTGGGGGSDNTFYVDGNDKAVAGASDGIDTIIGYWGSLTLPAGFSVGQTNGPSTLTGNNLNDILIAESGYAQTIVGGSGDDLMIGSTSGRDRFVVDQTNGGSAAIENFVHGSDVVQLNSFSQFTGGFTAVKAAMTQTGSDVVLNLGGSQSITFVNQTIGQFTAADFATPLNMSGFSKMTSDDEFNTLSASANGVGTNWQFMTGTRANNHEAENYGPAGGSVSPFSTSNGVLDITASQVSTAPGLSYTSGGLTTQKSFKQTYGLFEVNAEMPTGAGMWPAFWLYNQSGTASEIDAPEILGNNPYVAYLSTHAPNGADTTVAVTLPVNTSTSFNTYGVDWEPDTITYYFNGNAIATLPTPVGLNQPMYMLLNLAVGSTGSWPGNNAGETGQMLVNWVRAYASPNTPTGTSTNAPPLMLNGWNGTVKQGNGNYTVAGTGYNGHITLGNGNQTIALTVTPGSYSGSADSIVVGNGNQTISTQGSYNSITTGAGTSNINAGVSDNHVTIGATPAGTVTKLTATGWGNSFTSTAAGDVSITGTTGGSTVTLGAGNHSINLSGSYNTIKVGAGNSTIVGGIGEDSVTTGAGNSTITVTGYNNILDAGPGTNTLNGGSGKDVFILNGYGQGEDTITGFKTNNGDLLDFTSAMNQLGKTPTAALINQYLTSSVTSAGTVISIVPPSGPTQAIALLSGVSTTITALVNNQDIRLGSTVY